MRATTAFNRTIAIDGVVVEGVTFAPEGVVVRIRRRKRRHQCPCGFSTKVHYDRSTRRWRHLDLGAAKCFLEAEISRIECSTCQRVRTEEVPWARPGASSRVLTDRGPPFDCVGGPERRTDDSRRGQSRGPVSPTQATPWGELLDVPIGAWRVGRAAPDWLLALDHGERSWGIHRSTCLRSYPRSLNWRIHNNQA